MSYIRMSDLPQGRRARRAPSLGDLSGAPLSRDEKIYYSKTLDEWKSQADQANRSDVAKTVYVLGQRNKEAVQRVEQWADRERGFYNYYYPSASIISDYIDGMSRLASSYGPFDVAKPPTAPAPPPQPSVADRVADAAATVNQVPVVSTITAIAAKVTGVDAPPPPPPPPPPQPEPTIEDKVRAMEANASALEQQATALDQAGQPGPAMALKANAMALRQGAVALRISGYEQVADGLDQQAAAIDASMPGGGMPLKMQAQALRAYISQLRDVKATQTVQSMPTWQLWAIIAAGGAAIGLTGWGIWNLTRKQTAEGR